MTEPADRVGAYLALVLGGAEFADERLAGLRGRMTAEEVEAVKQRLIAECVKELPPGPGPSSAPPAAPDCCWLYLELVRRGARPDDRRLAMLADMMSDEELERAKAGISEFWLRAEPRPARPN